MSNFAFILSGCGSYDGSDVWEVVLLSYYLSRGGGNSLFFAPDWEQKEVVDHATKNATPERRNILKESARIAVGGEIKEIKMLSGRDVDGLILPGGDGVIKNLVDFIGEPENSYLKPKSEVQRIIREIYRRKKPIGACGLSNLIVASALRDILETPLTLTIGKDPELITRVEGMGALHVLSRGAEVVIDSEHKVVSTPGNILKLKITDLAFSMENLISGVLELTSTKSK